MESWVGGEGAGDVKECYRTMPIMGGEGGNEAILEGVGLGEYIARHGVECVGTFLEGKYEWWRREVEDRKSVV